MNGHEQSIFAPTFNIRVRRISKRERPILTKYSMGDAQIIIIHTILIWGCQVALSGVAPMLEHQHRRNMAITTFLEKCLQHRRLIRLMS